MFTPASATDLPRLLALMAAFYAEEGLDFHEPRAARALGGLLADPRLGAAFLVDGDQGYVVLTAAYSLEFAGPFLLLDEIYLVPAARGRGLGKATLGFVADHARAHGFAAVRLEVERHNARARAVYAQAGFVAHDRELLTRALG